MSISRFVSLWIVALMGGGLPDATHSPPRVVKALGPSPEKVFEYLDIDLGKGVELKLCNGPRKLDRVLRFARPENKYLSPG